MQNKAKADVFAHKTKLEQCNTYVLRYLQARKAAKGSKSPPTSGPAVTIANQIGVGEDEIAILLSERLREGEQLELTQKEAAVFVADSDRDRGRYIKTYFHAHVEDNLLYHLVINTDRIPFPDVAQLIASAARKSFRSTVKVEAPAAP